MVRSCREVQRHKDHAKKKSTAGRCREGIQRSSSGTLLRKKLPTAHFSFRFCKSWSSPPLPPLPLLLVGEIDTSWPSYPPPSSAASTYSSRAVELPTGRAKSSIRTATSSFRWGCRAHSEPGRPSSVRTVPPTCPSGLTSSLRHRRRRARFGRSSKHARLTLGRAEHAANGGRTKGDGECGSDSLLVLRYRAKEGRRCRAFSAELHACPM